MPFPTPMETGPPCPEVRFDPSFLGRLEGLVPRLAAARERREGAGRARFAGLGEEFTGYRPYRPGEDLRRLDWSLLARLDRPWVRVMQREASERWALLLDTSASMGVGPPGKLQRAAEIACALAALALRVGATLRVSVSAQAPGSNAVAGLVVRRQPDLLGLMAFLATTRATGKLGLSSLLAGGAIPPDAGRVFLVGDLFDLSPADVERHVRPGRELFVLGLLAPCELTPATLTARAVRWTDPESGVVVDRVLDRAERERYERTLEARLADWRGVCARHGVGFHVAGTERSFEDVLRTAAIA